MFINDIWDADLTDMKLISKFSKRICPSLCVIDIFSKYAWAIDIFSIGILTMSPILNLGSLLLI